MDTIMHSAANRRHQRISKNTNRGRPQRPTAEFTKWTYVECSLAGYGGLWFLMLFFALISQSHIDAGAFGLFGFPVVAIIYGILRGNAIKGRIQDTAKSIESLKEAVILAEQGAQKDAASRRPLA
jgi:hypothetical protein